MTAQTDVAAEGTIPTYIDPFPKVTFFMRHGETLNATDALAVTNIFNGQPHLSIVN